MNIEELANILNLIDKLPDHDFQTIHNIIHLRAMKRAKARYPKTPDKPKKGEDETRNNRKAQTGH